MSWKLAHPTKTNKPMHEGMKLCISEPEVARGYPHTRPHCATCASFSIAGTTAPSPEPEVGPMLPDAMRPNKPPGPRRLRFAAGVAGVALPLDIAVEVLPTLELAGRPAIADSSSSSSSMTIPPTLALGSAVCALPPNCCEAHAHDHATIMSHMSQSILPRWRAC